MEAKNVTISQVVDVTKCREKAEKYKGMATAVVDKLSKQVGLLSHATNLENQRYAELFWPSSCFFLFATKRGESVYSTVRNVYTIKPTTEGGLLTKAEGRERQHFTPFNVKGGAFKMQAT